MLKSLGLVYRNHGGPLAIIASEYFWISAILTWLFWSPEKNEFWIEQAGAVMPALIGFSIAAFAVVFSALDENARRVLSVPEPELNNRSPFLVLISAISHATIVQVISLIYSVCYSQKPFSVIYFHLDPVRMNFIFSFIGALLFFYAVMLVLASLLTIFRILEIKARL